MPFLNKEQKLIARIKDMVGEGGSFIGDDCAVLPAVLSGKILVTTDTLVEQTHFSLSWTPFESLGWKAMAVNLSDIAAMAGVPKYALIVLSAPEELFISEKIIALYEGLVNCAKQYKTLIVGGDITRGPSLTITITIIGQTHKLGLLERCGAQAGDVIIVSGDFGSSNVGLRLLQNNSALVTNFMQSAAQAVKSNYAHCLREFLQPYPKLEESWRLVERIGSRGALMDTSDGLADGLLQISQANNIGMQIDLQSIPVHAETKKYAKENGLDPIKLALYGGEDYQLLATLSADDWQNWQNESPDIIQTFRQIGFVTNSKDIRLMLGNEIAYELDPANIFQHIS